MTAVWRAAIVITVAGGVLAALAGADGASAATRTLAAPGTAAVGGTWGTAQEVPGTASLNKGVNAQVNSVSCGAAGNCSTGGVYADSSYHWHAFIVSES